MTAEETRMRKDKSAPIKDIDETDETDETGETEAGRMRQALPPPEIPPFYPQKCGDASEATRFLHASMTCRAMLAPPVKPVPTAPLSTRTVNSPRGR